MTILLQLLTTRNYFNGKILGEGNLIFGKIDAFLAIFTIISSMESDN